MRALVFAKRNFKEILRDPISYIFGLGMPVLMLIVMTVINNAIPPEANMVIFRIDNLSCGIAVFSLTFTSLSAALLVSKDRTGAFITRLYTSPMKAWEFVLGYAIPLFFVAIGQIIVTFLCSGIIAFAVQTPLSFSNVIIAFLALVPSAILFVAIGVCIGFLLNDKSAPPVCSVMISLGGLLGGIWFDCTVVGGFIETVCRILPFFNAVTLARTALSGNVEELILPFVIVLCYTVAFCFIACMTFIYRRKKA